MKYSQKNRDTVFSYEMRDFLNTGESAEEHFKRMGGDQEEKLKYEEKLRKELFKV